YSYSTLLALSGHIQEEMEQEGITVSSPVVSVDISEKAFQSDISKATKGRQLISWRTGSQGRVNQSTKPSSRPQSIAVVGMAGQFPEAGDVEVFWENIAQGKNCISEIPKKRWDID
uniref:beta-ketoacyl synthase N-terminal-like domain-containing protein n=1 Tax=Aquimarina macrocephali TaxID=666563 RepID=UPI000550072E